jgi:precorrin-2 dehydrogenase/sirohydrochlorin ferrochelatase
MALYPVNLNITGRLCVVVGGGSVAFRKVSSLLECGADIRIVSPSVTAALQEIIVANRLVWFERDFAEGDLQGAYLAFAATSRGEVQELVKRDADRFQVLLNCADDPHGSDFHVPAHFRRGEMLVAVSTGGGSPALSRQTRRRLEREIGPEYEATVALLALVRKAVLRQGGNSSDNKEVFQNLLKVDIVEMVRDANWFELQMLLLRELPADIDAARLLDEFLREHDKIS